MKRKIISMFMLLAAGAASAQNDGGSRWSIVPKAGMTVATHVGDDATNNNIIVDARYHFGLMHAIKNQDVRRRYLLLTVGYSFGL